MGQTGSKLTAQGQVESSINDTINFIMAKVAAGEIDAATATELIAAARKDYESNVPVTASAQQAVQPQQSANTYQANPQTAYAVPEMEPEQTPVDYGQFATPTNYPHTYDVEDSYHVNKITNAQDTRGRGLKPLPKGFDRLYSEYKNGDISARSAATKLGITHPTFLKYVKECDVRLHKDDLVQTHNPRGLTERHAAATDAARNLNHDQDAPDSPLRDR